MKYQTKEIKPSRKVFISNYPHFRYWKKKAAADMLAEEPVNIYIHIPFCTQKCAYCYYKTEPLKNREELENFVDTLCREIGLANQRFNLKTRRVQSIYIGGGTPSLLPGPTLEKIVQTLRDNFTLRDPEFTLEAEPRTINSKKISAYKALGVNRISIGIQSFVNEIIEMSGRKHTGEKALKAIEIVKNAGDIVINIDLLSGLAGESGEAWAKTLDTAVNTAVHSITVYKMETYLNTEFFNRGVRKKQIQLPSEEQELEFMKQALAKFEASNYKPWSFFTFTRGGEFPHQYAINIWKGQDYCAFGPSAFGKLGNYNYQNANNLEAYREMVNRGELPLIRAYRLTGKDLMVKDLMLGMKLHRLSRKEFQDKHGLDFCSLSGDTLEELQADGYILVEDDFVTLTGKGILYGDYAGKRLGCALKKYLGLDELNLY